MGEISNEDIFSLCGAIAMVGWACLIIAPRWQIGQRWVATIIAPLLIGTIYAYLMLTNLGDAPEGGGFGTLEAVGILFSVEQLLLAGWIHYLAFDLFVGAWEVRDAQREGIHHLLVVPCLLATFMAGPAGLVLYWILRSVHQQFFNPQPTQA